MYDAAKAAFDRCGGDGGKRLYEQMVFRMTCGKPDAEANQIYLERLQTDMGALAAEAEGLVAKPPGEAAVAEALGAHILYCVRTAAHEADAHGR